MEVLRTRLCEWPLTAIDALALAPAGSAEPRLALGRASGAVELWDTTTAHLHSTSPGHARRSIRRLVWVENAAAAEESGSCRPLRLLSAGLHTEITEWDTRTLLPVASVPSGGGAVWALCAIDGGKRILAACDDGSVRVFTLGEELGEVLYERRLVVSKLRVLSCCFFGVDDVFVGGSDSRITKWSLKNGSCDSKMQVEEVKGSPTLIWMMASLGKTEVASGDSLGLVTIWDPIACVALHRFAKHQADVLTLASSPRGDVLLSAGVDARIVTYYRVPTGDERWVFAKGETHISHDIRALTTDGETFAAGGVSADLLLHDMSHGGAAKRDSLADSRGNSLRLGGFSPLLQTGSVAEDSRVMMCQKEQHLELWYLQPPKERDAAPEKKQIAVNPGYANVGEKCLPEAQLLLRAQLGSAKKGFHLTASAITADGRLFAGSDLNGTRLFHLSVEDLEVKSAKGLPDEVQRTAARALLFCGSTPGFLAIATWISGEVLVVDVARRAVAARFTQHGPAAPPAILAASTAGEWLASADMSGGTHIFSLDSLRHHARVPVGDEGFPTAIAFDALGKRLVVALSTHDVVVFDVEAQTLVANVPSPGPRIPDRLLQPHTRICGIAAPPGYPGKVILWGESFMLSLDLNKTDVGELNEDDLKGPPNKRPRVTPERLGAWQSYEPMRHIMAVHALDQDRWGKRLLADNYVVLEVAVPEEDERTRGAAGKPAPAKASKAAAQPISAMLLTLEVSHKNAKDSLPVKFQKKRFPKALPELNA